MKNLTVTKEYFVKRISDLCLRSGSSGFPKDITDQHILLKSAMLVLGEQAAFTEKEINEKLEYWVSQVSQIKDLDRVTLRRRLVDTGYLIRSKDGSSYQVAHPGPQAELFEAGIDQIDITQVVEAAREEIARRKRDYLAKAKGA